MARLLNSFAGRLITAVVLLVLLPTVLLGTFVYLESRATALDAATTRIAAISADLADRIDSFIVSERGLARYAAASREVRDYIAEPDDPIAVAALDTWLLSGPFTAGNESVEDVFILDAQGTCIASTNDAFLGESYGIRPYFQQAVGGTDAVSDWSIGMTSGKPGIYLASPIRGQYNEVAGVLVVKLKTEPVDAIVEQAYAADVRAVVINDAGVLLAAYDPSLRYSTVDDLTASERAYIESTAQFADEALPSLGLTTVREDLAAVEPGETVISREYELNGEPRVAALTGLEAQPWTVAVVVLLSDIESAAASIPLIIGVIAGLILVYAVLATLYLSRFVVRPIRELVTSSRELAAGRLTTQVPVRGDDEVAQLSEAFNSMAQEIRGNTERLESEVARRTAELEEANRAITQLSITDALTGCYNRLYLDQQLDREIVRADRYHRNLSVVMVDLDHFKEINDRFGHAMGDEVLRQTAHHLAGIRRQSDWIARFGGEEFAFVLPETSLEDALTLAERARAGLAIATEEVDGVLLSVTASFGVATLAPEGGDTPQTLLQRSDLALYRAKAAGRNRVESEPAI